MKTSAFAFACFALGLLACDDSSDSRLRGDAAAAGASCDAGGSDAPGRFDAAVQDAPNVDQRGSEPDQALAMPDAASDSTEAGHASMCAPAASCVNDLTGIGAADFSIAFTLTTTATVGSGVISQRAICMHSSFWDVRTNAVGALGFELEDTARRYTVMQVDAVLNNGQPHNVQVCRRAGRVYGYVDGKLAGQVESQTIVGMLAPLAIGTTKCGPLDGTRALVGTVADVCIGPI